MAILHESHRFIGHNNTVVLSGLARYSMEEPGIFIQQIRHKRFDRKSLTVLFVISTNACIHMFTSVNRQKTKVKTIPMERDLVHGNNKIELYQPV